MSIFGKSFNHGDFVVISNTMSELDGKTGRIIGLSTIGLIDFYIVELKEPIKHSVGIPPRDFTHSAIVLTETCLERYLEN